MAKDTGFKGARAKTVDVDFNGKTYKVTPLTFDDFCKLFSRFQSRKLRLVQSSIDDVKLRSELIREILGESMGEDFFGELASAEGVKWTIFESLRKSHKDITEEDIGELPVSKMNDLFEIVSTISGLSAAEEKKGLMKAEEESPQ